uniref:Uncharacterized protein n=1 Tax=Percolomonas cosmopolitus TaxID=63605 RepID=A0A7S1KPB8_9EUKA|mmetsp:Transcript_3783/g.14352  ORF Transcript_3783/g.14352 Transcript_3783/m.14352 type:complete len:2113 (+) Transcript_3783:284-6622(+)
MSSEITTLPPPEVEPINVESATPRSIIHASPSQGDLSATSELESTSSPTTPRKRPLSVRRSRSSARQSMSLSQHTNSQQSLGTSRPIVFRFFVTINRFVLDADCKVPRADDADSANKSLEQLKVVWQRGRKLTGETILAQRSKNSEFIFVNPSELEAYTATREEKMTAAQTRDAATPTPSSSGDAPSPHSTDSQAAASSSNTQQPFEMQVTLFLLNAKYKKKTVQFFICKKDNINVAKVTIDLGEIATDFINSKREYNIERKINFLKLGTLHISIDFHIQDTKPKQVLRKMSSPSVSITRYQRTLASAVTEIDKLKEELENTKLVSHENNFDLKRQIARLKKSNEHLQRLRDQTSERIMNVLSTRDKISAMLVDSHPEKEALSQAVQAYYDQVWNESNERMQFLLEQENDLRQEEYFLEKRMKFIERQQDFHIEYPRLIKASKAELAKVQKRLKDNTKQQTSLLAAFAQQDSDTLKAKREELNASKTALIELTSQKQTAQEEIEAIQSNKKPSKKDKKRLKDLKKEETTLVTQEKQQQENINILSAEIDVATQQHNAKKAEIDQSQRILLQREKQLLSDVAHYERKQREKEDFHAEMHHSLAGSDATIEDAIIFDVNAIRPLTEARITKEFDRLMEQKKALEQERTGSSGEVARTIQNLQQRVQQLEAERLNFIHTIEENNKRILEQEQCLEENEKQLRELEQSQASGETERATEEQVAQILKKQSFSSDDLKRIQSLVQQGDVLASQDIASAPQEQQVVYLKELEELCLEYQNETRLLEKKFKTLDSSEVLDSDDKSPTKEMSTRIASLYEHVDRKLQSLTDDGTNKTQTKDSLSFAQLQKEFTCLATEISGLEHAETLSSLENILQSKQEKLNHLQSDFKEKYQTLLNSQIEIEGLHQKKMDQVNDRFANLELKEGELKLEREDLLKQQESLLAQKESLEEKRIEVSSLEDDLYRKMIDYQQKKESLECRIAAVNTKLTSSLKGREENLRRILDRLKTEKGILQQEQSTENLPQFLQAVDACIHELLEDLPNVSEFEVRSHLEASPQEKDEDKPLNDDGSLLLQQREILSQKDAQIDALKEQVSKLKESLNFAAPGVDRAKDLSGQIRNLQEKCATLEDRLKNDNACHENQRLDLEQKLNTKNETVVQLKKNVAELTENLESNAERLQIAENYMQHLVNNLNESEDRFRAQQEAVSNLSEELRLSTDSVAQLKSEIASQQMLIQQLQEAEEGRLLLEKEMQQLRESLDASNAKYEAAEQSHQESLEEAAAKIHALQEDHAQMETIRKQLGAAKEAAATAEQRAASLSDERSEMHDRIHQAETLMNDLLKKVETLDGDNIDLRDQVRTARTMEQEALSSQEDQFVRIAEAEQMMNHLLFELSREHTISEQKLKYKDGIIKSQEKELDDLMLASKDLQASVSNHRRQLNEKNHELAEAKALADLHKRSVEQLKSSMEQLGRQIENKNRQIEDLNSSLTSTKQNLDLSREDEDSKVKRLNSQIYELTKQLEEQHNALHSSQNMILQLENERTFARENQELMAREKTEEIQQLRRQLDLISQEFINSQNKAIEELHEELANSRKSLEEEEKARQTLQEESINLQIQVNSLSERNERLHKQVDQKKQIETVLEQVKTELQSMQDQHNEEKVSLLSRVEFLEEQLQSAQLQNIQCEKDTESETQDASEKKSEDSDATQHNAQLESSLSASQERIAELTDELFVLQEKHRTELQALEDKLEAKSKDAESLQETHAAVKREHATQVREIAALRATLSEKNNIIQQERSRVDVKNGSLHSQLATLRETLEQRDRLIEQHEQRLRSTKSKNADTKRLVSYISTLETVVKNQKSQLDKRKQLTSKLQTQCEQLQREGNEERTYFGEQIEYLKKDLQRVAREASDQIQTLNDDLEAERKRSSSLRGDLTFKIHQLMDSLQKTTAERDELLEQLATSSGTRRDSSPQARKLTSESIWKQLEELKMKRREHEQRVLDSQFYLSSTKKKLQSRVDKLNQKEAHLREMRQLLKERFAALREQETSLQSKKAEFSNLSGRIQGALPKELRDEFRMLSLELSEAMGRKSSPTMSSSPTTGSAKKRKTLPDLRLSRERELEEWKFYKTK